MNDKNSSSFAKSIVPHLICCGGMVLLILGSTSSFGAWLVNGGFIAIGVAFLLPVSGLLLFRYINRARRNTPAAQSAKGNPTNR